MAPELRAKKRPEKNILRHPEFISGSFLAISYNILQFICFSLK
jgi:hypothetical protein